MRTKIVNLLPPVLLILLGLFSLKTLFHPGFYTSHDSWHIVARLFHFSEAIRDLQIPPRWISNLYSGFGYPLFIFTYQLPWYLATPWVLVGIDIFTALKIVFIFTFILSGITMYLWIKETWGTSAAFTSSFVYLFTPYRFANILVRANLGEAVSYVFIPLIFWSLFKLNNKFSSIAVLLGAIGIAGFLLSHAMVVFLFFIPFLFSCLILTIISKKKKEFLFGLTITCVLGFGLSAYYIIPAFYYQSQTVFKEIYNNLYLNHFTPLNKLIYSPWGYSAIGVPLEMSRQVGILIWSIFISSVVLVISKLIKHQIFTTRLMLTEIIFIITLFLSIWFMTPWSKFLWKVISPIAFIDFPWRFLAVTTFAGSVLAGLIITQIKNIHLKYLAISFIIIIGIYSNRNNLRVNQYTDIPLSLYIESELTTNTDDEYLPKWVNRDTAKKKGNLLTAEFTTFSNITQKTNEINFNYSAHKDSQLLIHQMYFPGWIFYTDQEKNQVMKNTQGELLVNLKAGSHTGRLKYKPTVIMRISEIVTIISFIILSMLMKFSTSIYRKIN